MNGRDLLGIAATAKIGDHPIHPMLVPFPIALLIATLACDLIFASTGNAFWADAALWSLVAALVMAALAALAGLTDFLGNAQIRALTDAWHHMIGNIVAVLLALASLAIRLSQGSAEAVLPWGLILSVVVVLLLLYTGWKGGELVYRHRVGVTPEQPTGERTRSTSSVARTVAVRRVSARSPTSPKNCPGPSVASSISSPSGLRRLTTTSPRAMT